MDVGKDWDTLLPYLLFVYTEKSHRPPQGFLLLNCCTGELCGDPLTSCEKHGRLIAEVMRVSCHMS